MGLGRSRQGAGKKDRIRSRTFPRRLSALPSQNRSQGPSHTPSSMALSTDGPHSTHPMHRSSLPIPSTPHFSSSYNRCMHLSIPCCFIRQGRGVVSKSCGVWALNSDCVFFALWRIRGIRSLGIGYPASPATGGPACTSTIPWHWSGRHIVRAGGHFC